MIHFPIEIINKIFTYVSSNNACLIRDSHFYQKEFPFFYLNHVLSYDIDKLHLQNDIIDINKIVCQDRVGFKLLKGMNLDQDDLDIIDYDDSSDEEDYDEDWYPLIYL